VAVIGVLIVALSVLTEADQLQKTRMTFLLLRIAGTAGRGNRSGSGRLRIINNERLLMSEHASERDSMTDEKDKHVYTLCLTFRSRLH
jgi:hypothetical protein